MLKDKNFYNMCCALAQSSTCLSRQIGAIIVSEDNNSILGIGVNGPPSNALICSNRVTQMKEYDPFTEEYRKFCKDNKIPPGTFLGKKCPRQILKYKSGEGLHLCIAGHAERNAIIDCARKGNSTKGAKIYMNCPIPCKDCFTAIIEAGIVEIICIDFEYYDSMSKLLVKDGIDNPDSDLYIRRFKF